MKCTLQRKGEIGQCRGNPLWLPFLKAALQGYSYGILLTRYFYP